MRKCSKETELTFKAGSFQKQNTSSEKDHKGFSKYERLLREEADLQRYA